MQRPHARLAVIAAVLATVGLASCQGESPTESLRERAFLAGNDAPPGDSVPGDSTPGDSIPGDSIPGDSIPGDSIPGDSIPGDSIPGDSIPGDSIPGDSIPGDSTPPDTLPPDSTVESFDLYVSVVGATDSTGDTLHVTPLQGARVTVLRFDSLPDSTSTPNVVASDRPTNIFGAVTLRNLPPAWYRVDVTPPKNTPYLAASRLVAPATSPQVPVQVLLPRAP